jgi:Uri superfamily endonuclease
MNRRHFFQLKNKKWHITYYEIKTPTEIKHNFEKQCKGWKASKHIKLEAK